MSDTTHFDRRGSNYDRAGMHQRIVDILLAPFAFADHERILDLATGTGLVALKVAKMLGPSGRVIGLDNSQGMLTTARRDAGAARLSNVRFELGNAEEPHFAAGSFDRLFCASALVLMSDIPAALRRWRDLLKPGGTIAFDTPSQPFGFSQRASDAALRHGVDLRYGEVANTPSKCRALVQETGYEVVSVRKKVASNASVPLDQMIELYDERLDHPAWRGIREARLDIQAAIRADYIDSAIADAADGMVPNIAALCFTTARNPDSDPSAIAS